jgi:hypothetical protein
VQNVALLQSSSQGPVQTVFEVQVSAPPHDMGEQVAKEGGVVIKQSVELEGCLSGDQFVETNLSGRNAGPAAGIKMMGRVRPLNADALEDHGGDYIGVTRAGYIPQNKSMPAASQWIAFLLAAALFIQVPARACSSPSAGH